MRLLISIVLLGFSVAASIKVSSDSMAMFLRGGSQEVETTRHTFDVIRNILERRDEKEELYELREMIAQRAQEYLRSGLPLEHPKKLLHYIAPRIPAIKKSPDVVLRIQSARRDVDAGAAAAAIGTLALISETYETATNTSDSSGLVADRRFEQLVECTLCGVNVRKRKRQEAILMGRGNETDDMEELLDEEDAKINAGLSVSDACRAAWGMAFLGGYNLQSIGGEAPSDIFLALSLRVRELLLARLQMLREGQVRRKRDGMTLSEQLDLDAEELAVDAARAMWSFACVKACTGTRCVLLLETCCSILCQIPSTLRERNQAKKMELDNKKNHAMNETINKEEVANDTKNNTTTTSHDDTSQYALLDWLSNNEIIDIVWSLAVHGSEADEDGSEEEISLSETAAALSEVAFDRLSEWLRKDLETMEAALHNVTVTSVQELQVVDAATLLNSETSDPVETEVIVTSSYWQKEDSWRLQFSVGDLCSIAWAVTDLRDSFRNVIVDFVAKIISKMGRASMNSLDGGDLSNLAWAIARRSSDHVAGLEDCYLNITKWIAERSSVLIDADGGDDKRSSELIMQRFEPPELGRMMWSLATAFQTLSWHDQPSNEASYFARIGLRGASDNLALFGTDDLARISWGFLELGAVSDDMSDAETLSCLGSLVAITEGSTIRWESGQCAKPVPNPTSRLEESVRFASFLGRPRTSLKLLEQTLGGFDEDDNEGASAPVLTEKSALPLLRDLSMDPATMCKLAASLSRMQKRYPSLQGAWTFVRVAVRLLTSKQAQLLRESNIRDVLRLCYACAANEQSVAGRDYVTRVYARRVVQHLNELLQGLSKTTAQETLGVSSSEMALTLWSLGELGVRHTKTDENKSVAYKRLRLVTSKTLLSKSQIASLSLEMVIMLTQAVVSLNMVSSDPAFVTLVLLELESRFRETPESLMIDLIECLAKLGSMVGDVQKPVAIKNRKEKREDDEGSVSADNTDDDDETSEDIILKMTDEKSLHADIKDSCNGLLSKLSALLVDKMRDFSATDLRRLILVFATVPFEAPETVQAIEHEVYARLRMIEELSSMGPLIERAEEEENVSRFASLKGMLHSVFGKEKYGSTKNLGKGLLIRCAEQGSAFELGRCRELLAGYKRVDFATGERETRYDIDRRKDMGKRVLRRLKGDP